MNKAGNGYWVDDRLLSQRVAPRSATTFGSAREFSEEILGTRTEIRRRGGVIPSWVVFGMIILATLCLCVSVTKRTHAEMRAASDQYSKMSAEVEALRRSNRDLAVQVRRMKSDPVAIEAAARERLNMVRSNELVVPIE